MRTLTIRTDDIPFGVPEPKSLQFIQHSTVRPWQRKLLYLLEKSLPRYSTIFLQAPPGTGKTAIASAINKLYLDLLPSSKTLMLVGRKQLLTQARDNYGYDIFMGQNEYRCLATPNTIDPDGSGREVRVNVAPCKYLNFDCPYHPDNRDSRQCAYYALKKRILDMRTCAVSTLTGLNISDFHGRDLLVVDEADNFFKDLISYFTFPLDEEYYYTKYKIRFNRDKLEDKNYWDTEIPHLIDEIDQDITALTQKTRSSFGKKLIQYKFQLHNTIKRFENLCEIRDLLMTVRNNFVICHDHNKHNPPQYVKCEFKPISISKTTARILTSLSKFRIFMGATLNPYILARQLGIDDKTALVIDYVKHPYPAKNRRIRVIPYGSMSYNRRNATLPDMLRGIEDILSKHKGQAGLILPNSKWLHDEINNDLFGTEHEDRIITHEKGSYAVNRAISEWNGKKDGLLLSTYLSMGFDGSHGDFIIIPKVPFPNLKDPWVKARKNMKHGQEEYNWNTVRDIRQKSARCTRSPTDKSITYITDSDFMGLLNRNRDMFPEYFHPTVEFS